MANTIQMCKLAVMWTALATILLIGPSNGQSSSVVVLQPTVTESMSTQLPAVSPSLSAAINASSTFNDMMPQTITSSMAAQSSIPSQPPPISTSNFVSTGAASISTTMLPQAQSTSNAVVPPVMTSSTVPVSNPVSSVPVSPTSSGGMMLPTNTPTPTTDSPTTRPNTDPSMSPGGLGMGAIIGIAAGGGAVVVLLILFLLFCCCCCLCCRSSSKEEYTVRPYGPGNVVVRKWDPRTQHGRPDSIGGSMRSNGRHSFARSSISSVGSFLRASIRRLSGKRRSGKRTSRTVVEDEVTMKVTPL